MAQTGYTPISLYYSTTAAAAPTAGNLVAGELALNTQDEKLYFKNAAGTVKLLASSAGALGSVTSVAQTFTGGLISVSGSPITSSGTLALTVAGTSGGIPYFSSASTWATSAALAANALVIGGGAGVAPSTTTTGTGVLTALGVNVGTAGAFVVNGGALGTPSSGTVTNLTGTASININGTVGATTPSTGAFTTLSATGLITKTNAAATPSQFLSVSGSTTAQTFGQITNTGGNLVFGIESSVGGQLISGDAAYSSAIYTANATNLYIGINNAAVAAFSSTGLAVTGALSATGNLTVTGGTITTGSTINNIILNTSDGADNGTLTINGGGAGSASTRGAYITVAGNEHASTGAINMVAGNVTGGEFNVYTADTKYLSLSRTGTLTLAGGTITTGSTTALNLATSGGTGFRVDNVASQVNFLRAYGSASGGGVAALDVSGADTNIGVQYFTKGTGNHFFYTNAGTEQVRINHTASANRYITLTGSNGAAPVIGTSAGDLAFSPAGTERMRIDSSGKVGIGTSTPTQNLSVNGYISVNSNNISADNSLGFRNRIINGAMVIDQRNAGASVTPTDGSYTLDRYLFRVSQSSKLTCQQSSTAPTGFKNSLLVTSSSAYSVGASDFFAIEQRIEGFNVADCNFGTANAVTVTLSFWVRSSLTGTFGGAFANGAFTRSYPFTYTINSANTWEQKTITVAGDTSGTWATDSSAGFKVQFGLGVGSTYSGTANSWQNITAWSATGATSVVGTNGATFYITGVQLEVGSVATPFERRPYGTELQLCQRYYWQLALNARATGGISSTSSGEIIVPFPQTMRASATFGFSGTVGNVHLNDYTADDVLTSFSGATATAQVGFIQANSSASFTVGKVARIYGASTDYLTASAEL